MGLEMTTGMTRRDKGQGGGEDIMGSRLFKEAIGGIY